MNKSFIVTSSLLSFLLGVFLGPFELNQAYLFLLTLVLLSLIPLWKKQVLFFLLIVLCVLGGYGRYQMFTPTINEQLLSFYNEQGKFTVLGKICAEPDRRNDKTNLTLCAESLDGREVTGKLLISKPVYPEFKYGEKLKVSGKLLTPIEFDTFSYKDYLARYGIHSVIYNPFIEKVAETNKFSFFYWIFRFKESYESLINRLWHEPQASFLAGLLLGSRKGIPENLMEDFNTTGLTHIIAISGYNITLIIVILAAIFKPLPRKLKFCLTVFSIVSFTILVGASAAVVRASIMGIISLIALQSGRQSQISIVLLLSAVLMLAVNPLILRSDVGFQLSFLATLGLIYVSPYFEKFLSFLPNTLAIRESLSMTLSAQVTAVPLILSTFGRLSLISPLANLLVAPAIPLSMLFGFLASAIYAIFPPLGTILSWIAWLTLEYIIKVTELCAAIPLASVETGTVGTIWLFTYYLLLTLLLVVGKQRIKKSINQNY
ncbi:MAG: ComEC/Rec2 family competence protein [Candidatus Gracilibacteria bacterium]|nr:ComEC/Rec2 family competence protein [Candidatus Gracilibacteria bacterium]